MKSYIFYHLTPLNDYYERFLKTFSKVEKSGLLGKVDKFFVFLNGEVDENVSFHDKICAIKNALHPNESVTINSLRDFCVKNENCNILYLHCKGVTKPDNQNINCWIDLMEYFLIEKHSQCIDDLRKYDAAGVNAGGSPLHFSGNFWWASSNYISKLGKCPDSYYAPEMWVLSKSSQEKVKCYFKTAKDLYYQKIERHEYES